MDQVDFYTLIVISVMQFRLMLLLVCVPYLEDAELLLHKSTKYTHQNIIEYPLHNFLCEDTLTLTLKIVRGMHFPTNGSSRLLPIILQA